MAGSTFSEWWDGMSAAEQRKASKEAGGEPTIGGWSDLPRSLQEKLKELFKRRVRERMSKFESMTSRGCNAQGPFRE